MADFDTFEGRLSPSCLEEIEEEALDPRVQIELERLNRASEDINRLELELDDGRACFRQALTDSTHKLDTLAKKLGSCVEKARPYYEARHRAKEVHVETQKAAYMFERACSMHEAAKEMVQLAEQGYMQREDSTDPAWQEMLNHATSKVNDAEQERLESEKVHLRTTQKFKEAEDQVQRLQKDLKRSINKSKLSIRRSFLRLSDIVNQFDIQQLPYFEMKAKFNQMMEDRKRSVTGLEQAVTVSKKSYSEALRNLEQISEDIHRQRLEMKNQAELGIRGAGVGSESPSPPPMRGKDHLSIDGTSTQLVSSCSTGISPTTITSTQSSDTFRPPSVIYSSPEKARSQSYRDAIDCGRSGRPSVGSQNRDNIDEDYTVNLDDEYLALPGHSQVDTLYFSNDNTPTGDDIFEENRSDKKVISPGEIRNIECKVGDRPLSDYKQGNSSGENTPLSSFPSGRGKKSSKLKGLILMPVGAGLDPLQVNLRITTKPGTSAAKQNTEASRPASYPYSHNATVSSAQTKVVVSPTVNAPAKEEKPKDVPTPGSDKSHKRLLKVPSMQDFDEGSISDTESITSGTMLDDDQVEFLTMDFSKQRLAELDEEEPETVDKNWRRMSLPPNLSHLENYIRRLSATQQEDFDEEDNTLKEDS